MDTSKFIAQVRVNDCATVRVLQITPNVTITCDRNCASLREADDGSIECFFGWVKNMANFQTTALVVDYEIILERKADQSVSLMTDEYQVIDEFGQIHTGEHICRSLVSPKGLSGGIYTLYPGTRGRFRIYYESFPRDAKVVSIIVGRYRSFQGRIDLKSFEPMAYDSEEEQKAISEALAKHDDLESRVVYLERQVKRLTSELISLKYSQARKDNAYYDPEAPLSDSGIVYHPLDNK